MFEIFMGIGALSSYGLMIVGIIFAIRSRSTPATDVSVQITCAKTNDILDCVAKIVTQVASIEVTKYEERVYFEAVNKTSAAALVTQIATISKSYIDMDKYHVLIDGTILDKKFIDTYIIDMSTIIVYDVFRKNYDTIFNKED